MRSYHDEDDSLMSEAERPASLRRPCRGRQAFMRSDNESSSLPAGEGDAGLNGRVLRPQGVERPMLSATCLRAHRTRGLPSPSPSPGQARRPRIRPHQRTAAPARPPSKTRSSVRHQRDHPRRWYDPHARVQKKVEEIFARSPPGVNPRSRSRGPPPGCVCR